ncbi:tetratricopeptide repeat protein [Lyngbya sp. CCY1209]|uniref:tetratricopeptide repeat protein n=1 Tax=Lyngbya sp. CCY1209 TaxID=2886103 RepID=UPI002D1FF597|nr:tetratricopeptide repeat protein [Lyngbya sp. CCY1209]MEB3886177.1 tetratricopeptide repeat protein [Lyngbya sp. CCY1209]
MIWISKFSPLTGLDRIPLLALSVALGLAGSVRPAAAQALLPYTLKLESEQLEQTGLGLIEEAAQLTRFQQYQLALPRAELATQLAPDNYQTWALLGSLYVQTERVEEGIEALQKARALEPDNPGILFVLGEAYFRRGEYQKSVDEIEKGLQLQPDVPGALFDLGNAYFRLEQFDEAIARYEKAYEQEKSLWPAINNIGLVEYELGETESAVRRWREAIAIDEAAAEPMLAIAVALHRRGEAEKALELGQTALQLDIRYADVEFLRENLWGDRLIRDTQAFLSTPQMRETITALEDQPAPGMP